MNDTSPSLSSTATVPHDEVSRRAQELWESYGRPSGRDDEIWLEAERSLLAQRTTSTASSQLMAQPAAAPDPAPRLPSGRGGKSGGNSAAAKMPGSRIRKN